MTSSINGAVVRNTKISETVFLGVINFYASCKRFQTRLRKYFSVTYISVLTGSAHFVVCHALVFFNMVADVVELFSFI